MAGGEPEIVGDLVGEGGGGIEVSGDLGSLASPGGCGEGLGEWAEVEVLHLISLS